MHRLRHLSSLLLLVLLSLCVSRSDGADLPEWFVPSADGSFRLDGLVHGRIVFFDSNWKMCDQSPSTILSPAKNGNQFTATFVLHDNAKMALKESAIVDNGGVRYSVALRSFAGSVNAKQVSLALTLPVDKYAGRTVQINGQPQTLPVDFGKVTLSSARVSRVSIPMSSGNLVVSADNEFVYLIQDNRKYNSSNYELRFLLAPSSGDITEASINLKFENVPLTAQVVDLRAAANMGFQDQTAEDGKGGWTDQGPENDLHMLKSGRMNCYGVPFDILAPSSNNGKSCVVLSGRNGSGFPVEATIGTGDKPLRNLYLLHAAAWARDTESCGTIEVEYQDSEKSSIDVKTGRDVADWWGACPVENGAVVWTAENRSSYVGLYMSRFILQNKPVRKITLRNSGNAVWMVVAMSGIAEEIPLPVQQAEYYVVENNEWKPFSHSLDVKSGSALDFSFLADAPAGKHGRVIINPKGKFAFEDAVDTPVRFYGSNLCFGANFLEKQQCEKLAQDFSRYGYNALRIHHHDQGMIDASQNNSLTLDNSQMDKLDYLFYCMKKNGIYITTDIYVSRRLTPSETGVFKQNSRDIKALVPFSTLVMENIKSFAASWLNHVNPYTGIAWKDDPALFAISFVNENTMYSSWQRTPEVKQAYGKEFDAWVAQNHIPASTAAEREAALCRFSTQMQINSYEQMRSYVKDELGCNSVYSDCNMQAYRAQQIARNHFDYVDNHGYWDHPRFPVQPWRFPYGFHNTSVLKRACSMPAEMMPTRIFGKPFTFTEYNYVFPNVYRSEGAPVMGAYAALQDWDAVYRFAFSHNQENATSVRPAGGFDVATDPIALLGERIAALLFLRADISSAQKKIPFVMDNSVIDLPGSGTNGNGFSKPYSRLGLIHQIGTVVADNQFSLPDGSLSCVTAQQPLRQKNWGVPCVDDGEDVMQQLGKLSLPDSGLSHDQQDVFNSDTGQIRLDAATGCLRIRTPRSECLVLPAGTDAQSGVMTVSACNTYSTVFAASLDDQDLKDSNRVLLLHLTDIKNSLTKFANDRMTQLEKNGNLPHLVKCGSADVKLCTSHTTSPQVWALDITGKRLGEIDWNAGGFTAITASPYGQVMAYELVWK